VLLVVAMQRAAFALAFLASSAHARTVLDQAAVDKVDPQRTLALLALAQNPSYQPRAARSMARRATLSKIAKGSAIAAATLASAAQAGSRTGVNGQLDFGPLAGDQPGGEGTGKALGANDDVLLVILFVVPLLNWIVFKQWGDIQEDRQSDSFEEIEKRRTELGRDPYMDMQKKLYGSRLQD